MRFKTLIFALLLLGLTCGESSAQIGRRYVQQCDGGSCRLVQVDQMQPQTTTAPIATAKTPRADGLGFCSDQCSCGCNVGKKCSCGEAKTTHRKTEPLANWQTSGVLAEEDRESAMGEHYRLNGAETTRAAVVSAMTAGSGSGGIPDDSRLWRVVVIGSPALTGSVATAFDGPELAAWKGKVVVQQFRPDHWSVKDKYPLIQDPTIHIVTAEGRRLRPPFAYTSAADLAASLRKCDPNKSPGGTDSPISDDSVFWLPTAALIGLGLFLRKG